jgi:hypothetical protein
MLSVKPDITGRGSRTGQIEIHAAEAEQSRLLRYRLML